ncbi:hypothetical protein G6F68_012731 [Rhizopus microsporus]|nr:hypothetical protein G6F68_012731 [Rhizopus microsporus]
MSEIQYGLLPQLEKQLAAAQEAEHKDFRLVQDRVTDEEIAEVVSRWTGIPVNKMLAGERDKLLRMDEVLHNRVVGQEEAIKVVSDAVRRSRAGETLKLLDGRDAALDDSFLVVTDADRAVGLAGLMGGFDTRVPEAPTAVFLEAAHFAPAAIMGRGRKLGLHTDAGHRFERGVDPALPRTAIEYATRLVLDLAGGTPAAVTEASSASCARWAWT